ncbi:Protein SRT-62 [Aphelenchoides avenae]|nr:Protein SRT-62 [Aphelenchus avenae]
MSTCLRIYSRYDEYGNEVNEPTTVQDIVAGASVSFLAAVCIALNAFMIKKSFEKGALCFNSSKFTVFLSVSSLAQLTAQFVSGMFTVSQNVLHPAFSKALGAILESSHMAYTLTIAVLALNRLVQIAFPVWDDRLFSPMAVKLWYAFIALVASAFLLLLSLPWATFRFRPEQWSWTYDYGDKMSHTAQSLQSGLEYTCVLFWGVVYVVVFAFIVREVLVPSTRYAYLTVQMMWIFNCAVNPLAYFVHGAPVEGLLKLVCGSVCHKTILPTTPSPTASVSNMQANANGSNWPRRQWKKRPATAVTGEAEGRSMDLTPNTFQKHKEDQRVEQFTTNRKIVFLT